MNATEYTAVRQGIELHDELSAGLDQRTLDILDRRRKSATVRRRGWLVRRMLLTADVTGLVVAIFVAEWLVNRQNPSGALDSRQEILVLLATLPCWVVIAKLYGLYDRDEERTDHSTTDDFAPVFHMVTVSTWLFWVMTTLTGVAEPGAAKTRDLLGGGHSADFFGPRRIARVCATQQYVPPKRGDRRSRRRRAVDRQKAITTP